jgi:4-amino-4-deoxy-L-arabinose transferase-like glycosyltransferase
VPPRARAEPGASVLSETREEFARLPAVLLWIALVWIAFPGYRDLAHPDEGRYAEIPREMAESGDWVTPRLDGLRYFEKPPLQYWATAAAFRLLGVGNATARIWPVGLGLLTVGWVYLLGRRLFDRRTGAAAAIVLSSTLLWVGVGHILTLDTGLSAFLALAVGALAWAQSCRGDPARLRRWMLVAWAALGLATLSKGPVAIVLAGGTLLVYGFWQRDLAVWRHLHLGKGFLLFLAIAAPWFVAVGLRNPGFARFFFLHEHFERFTTDVHHRDHPWWTYLPVLLAGSLPWTVPVAIALVRPGFRWRSGAGGFDPVRLLWVACAFTFLFFSVSHSKLVPYVQPAFPFLALLAARALRDRASLKAEAATALLLGLAVAGATLVPGWFASAEVPRSLLEGYRPFLFASAGVLAAVALAVLVRGERGLAGIAWLGGAGVLAFQFLLWGFQSLSPIHSSREIARAIDAAVGQDVPVYVVSRYDQPLTFYLAREVELVDVEGELAFGLAQDPDREIPDLDRFRAIWTARDQGVAVLPRSDYGRLRDAGLPMRVIHEDPRRVAVLRR